VTPAARPSLVLLIPAYNAAAYLPRLLRSAAAQTEPFDEVWVYDDCSTDDTAAVARSLGAQVVSGAVNRGCSAGKNALARETSAEWIHFHDADDELMPNYVSLARRWIERDDADVVLFPYEERNDATGEHITVRRFDPPDVARDARSYAIREQINPFCGLYRRAAFLEAGGYDEDPLVLFNEDVAMHIGLAFAGLRFAAETEVSIINHRRLDSMSAANGLKCAQAQYHVLRKACARPGASAYAPALASRLWRVAGVLGSYLDWHTADQALAMAARLAPAARKDGSALFRTMASVSPGLALRLREYLVRSLKRRLRSARAS
jgi:glycosyltransferase involved in cell wall biosynthesis